MLCKDVSFSSPEENILFDEVLLHMADRMSGEEVLRFWESPSYFVVLGRIGKAEEDVHLKITRQRDVPVLRRFSGGGTVVQGPGCLNYSLVLSKESRPEVADLRKSYAYILTKMIRALSAERIQAVFRPISDLAVFDGEKKFSGNAQHRGRQFILHHGTILYDFDLKLISEFLQIPKDVPLYRQGRSHQDFITNIPVSSFALKHAIAQEFETSSSVPLSEEEKKILEEFCQIKKAALSVPSTNIINFFHGWFDFLKFQTYNKISCRKFNLLSIEEDP